VLALLFRVLGETVYRRLLLFETDLARCRFEPDARCRWLRDDEAERYALVHPLLTAEQVRRRLADGVRCWVLELPEGAIAHGLWVATAPVVIEYLDVQLPVAAGEAYLFQSFTPAAYRGRRLASRALSALKAQLGAMGIRRTLSCILPDNWLAYPPAFSAGARPIAYIGWYGVGPWRRHFRRPTRRFPWYAPKRRPATEAEHITKL